MQLLRLRVSESVELDHFLQRKNHNLHREIEDEILQLSSKRSLSWYIIWHAWHCEWDSPKMLHFSVIVNGQQNVRGDEWQLICVWYVDDDFNIHEDFLRFYQIQSTLDADLSLCADRLPLLNLLLSRFRGLAFEKATNMVGTVRLVQRGSGHCRGAGRRLVSHCAKSYRAPHTTLETIRTATPGLILHRLQTCNNNNMYLS